MFDKKMLVIFSIVLVAGLMVACGKTKTKLNLTDGIRNENARQVDANTYSDSSLEDDGYEIPEMEGTNVVSIAKDGKLTNTISQSFEEDYYDKDSLETFIMAELSDYNREKGKDSVTLKSVKTDDEAQVVLCFENSGYFAEFNSQTFFYGTIEEAMLEDYNLNIEYIDFKSGENIDVNKALEKEKRHIVVTRSDRDRLNIVVPKDILYTSKNVIIDKKKKKEALAPQGELSVIITK